MQKIHLYSFRVIFHKLTLCITHFVLMWSACCFSYSTEKVKSWYLTKTSFARSWQQLNSKGFLTCDSPFLFLQSLQHSPFSWI